MSEFTAKIDEPVWACANCGTEYAEYVNGCPRCWNADELRSKVVLVNSGTFRLNVGEGREKGKP